MKKTKLLLISILVFIGLATIQCSKELVLDETNNVTLKSSTVDDVGNCLSFPVIWSEGIEKPLRGSAGADPELNGEWWYWWGIEGDDPNNTVILSGPPDPDDNAKIDDGIPNSVTGPDPGPNWVKAYLQKDAGNIWQAETANGSGSPVNVDLIDWGDNLESVSWSIRSQVRTEVVLYKKLNQPMLQYEMRHVDGWGINEVHGLAVQVHNNGNQEALTIQSHEATVYCSCARLTIQKLNRNRDDIEDDMLIWIPETGWVEADGYLDIIEPPIFNKSVKNSTDGIDSYAAEINVKGKIIYGYTWNVRRLNDGAGDYRITFSFDDTGTNGVQLNTFFTKNKTEILLIDDGDTSSDNGGGTGVIDFENNLTYIDVRINSSGGGNTNGSKKK